MFLWWCQIPLILHDLCSFALVCAHLKKQIACTVFTDQLWQRKPFTRQPGQKFWLGQQVGSVTGVLRPIETCAVVFVLSYCEMIPSVFRLRHEKSDSLGSTLKGWGCQTLTFLSFPQGEFICPGDLSQHCSVLSWGRKDMGKVKLLLPLQCIFSYFCVPPRCYNLSPGFCKACFIS